MWTMSTNLEGRIVNTKGTPFWAKTSSQWPKAQLCSPVEALLLVALQVTQTELGGSELQEGPTSGRC